MNYVFGKECDKHPEFAGKRYFPSNCCIGCQREWNRQGNARRLERLKAQASRLEKLEKFVRSLAMDHIEPHQICSMARRLNDEIQ